MAQRTVHYLLGEILLNDGIGSPNRFRMGNLLPDAYPDPEIRRTTHYIVTLPADTSSSRIQYSDFEAFRRQFSHEISKDTLYLGYYMHLIEDACFRVFWKENGLQGRIKSAEDIRLLHRDYHLLNACIVNKYHLSNLIKPISGLEQEPINQIYPFCIKSFLEEFDHDFSECPQGATTYLTPIMLDRFILDASEICKDALYRVLHGHTPLDSREICW